MPTDPRKRAFLRIAAASALGATALAGCGRKDEAGAPAAAPAAALPAAAGPLKAAWIYVGPVGNAGWSFAHDQGRLAVQAAFGDRVATSFVESVPEGAEIGRAHV